MPHFHRWLLMLIALVIVGASLASGQEGTSEATNDDATAEATATARATEDATAEASETPLPTEDATPEPTRYAQPDETRLYEPIVLRAAIDPARYSNPFDSADIELTGTFESPSGEQVVVPGFWLQPYDDLCAPPCVAESLQPSGEPEWQVRYTPTEMGAWTYALQVRDDGTLIDTIEGEFDVTESNLRGFIRVAPNHRYFQYDNGQPYFAIGHNLHWSWEGTGGLEAYERWFSSLRESGGNYARIVIDVPWFVGLEWETLGDYRAAQDDAARLDRVLEIARENGIAVQLVLLWHQALRTYSGPPVLVPEDPPRADSSVDWDDNPYNVANSGPLGGPNIFFIDATAQTMFRRRLRYIVARWAYSPQVFAWELVDEIDRAANTDPAVKDEWLQDMASYVRQIDPHRHLITAGSREYNELLVTNPQMDFTQGRLYQSLPIETTLEHETAIIDYVRDNLRLSDTPTLVTGHSLNQWFEPTANDPEGIHFQNTLWAAALAGAGGGAAAAWGDTYVVPQDLEQYYAPLAAFSSGVEWATLNLEPAEAGLLAQGVTAYEPVRANNFNRQFRSPIGEIPPRTISADGVFPVLDAVPSYLYGQISNNRLHQSQTYIVAPPSESYLEIGVRLVSDASFARLQVQVDGRVAAQMTLLQNTRGAVLRVPLSAGEHTIVLTNTGDDWLEMDYLEVGNLIAPARVLTLRDTTAGVALAWLQHRGYTWDQVTEGVEREPLEFTYRLDAMPEGRYVVELWDPLTGAVLGEESVRVGEDGVLLFDLLPLTRQLAIRAFRQSDEPVIIPTSAPSPVPTDEEATQEPLSVPALIDQLEERIAEPTMPPEETAEGA